MGAPGESITALKLLEIAKQTLVDRGVQRDCTITGERSMASTVKAFNALTGLNITEEQGWQFMILLKMVRGQQGQTREDDYVDMASYSALLGECRMKNTIGGFDAN